MKTNDKNLGAFRLGSSMAVAVLLAACRSSSPGAAYEESRVVEEPVSTTETTGAVLQHAEQVNADAVEGWSKVPPPSNTLATADLPAVTRDPAAPAESEALKNGNGAATQPVAPTAAPRSASEAAERNEPMRVDPTGGRPVDVPGVGGAAPTTPAPVAPTAPAETNDPLRGR